MKTFLRDKRKRKREKKCGEKETLKIPAASFRGQLIKQFLIWI
jgi:hypothetical protein